ncbi:SIS domain-containing protein [Clostridiaceae bacterium]|nr:SIS domain-containing protein [Clostridiaceae bacterium]RKI09581.1 SIS domain-containing protein [bacterium 1XD21-70]
MKNSEQTYREMYGQPVSFQAINDSLEGIYQVLDQVFAEEYEELIFTGCGTSLYLAQASAHAFAACTKIPAKGMCCSELYYFPEAYVGKGKKVLVLPITRKSYTTEVRMAIDKVRSFAGVKTLAITCDPDSAKYNDYMILSPETAEDSVIMTRSFTSMVYLAVVLAFYAGGKREKIRQMENYKNQAEEFLKATDDIAKKIVSEHPERELFITLGQGINYGIANECMNKMKEMSLSNSEAYYTLEYRHGPMSLVDDKTMIILLGNEETIEGDAKLLSEMKTYGAVTLAVGPRAAECFADADYTLDLDYGYDSLQNAAMIGFIGQMMGYYLAEKKSLNADTPRHLSQAIVIK